jgi:hypothetical protein
MQFFENLARLQTQGHASFNAALRRVALESRQTGVAVVLSDFLDPEGYEDGLKSLISRGFHVNAVQILSPEEVSPATFGELKLIDSETGAEQEVTFGKYRLQNYQRTVENFCNRLKEFCQVRGVSFFRATSDTALEQLLLKQLREAEVWK